MLPLFIFHHLTVPIISFLYVFSLLPLFPHSKFHENNDLSYSVMYLKHLE